MPLRQPTRRCFLRFIAGTAPPILLPSGLGTVFTLAAASPASAQLPEKISNAEEAAELVLSMAQQANTQGTFGVGGAIIENATGKVIHALHNNVLVPLDAGTGPLAGTAFPFDPTAHGERQLVTWYFANRQTLGLPAPSQLTIVTSLDPCAMCAGSLLIAGFNVAVVAHDDYAGVDWDHKTREQQGLPLFGNYPPLIAEGLTNSFGYFAVAGKRPYTGAKGIMFSDTEVSEPTAHDNLHIFKDNADRVRKASSQAGLDPLEPNSGMADPHSLPPDDPVRLALMAACPRALDIKLSDPRQPTPDIRQYLEGLVSSTDAAKNAVAFFDYYGNLLMASADRFDIDPVSSALMTVVRQYSLLRFKLMNNATTSGAALRTLASPKYGIFAFLHAPDGFSAASLKDLGVYGSTMEGPPPITTSSNFQFFLPPLSGGIGDLTKLIADMPPLYNQLVGINPQPIKT